MLVPDRLKLNRFKEVAIPSKRSYFARLGYAALPAASAYADGDTPVDAVGQTKIDAMAEAYDLHKDELDAPPAPDEE